MRYFRLVLAGIAVPVAALTLITVVATGLCIQAGICGQVGSHTLTSLKAHRERSTRKSADDLVFPNKSGEPMRESRLLERVLQPAAERAKLGRVTWHQFRHIHSSLLNDLRVPVKIAQEQLGHASIQTTLNIYTHVVDASHRAAIEQLEQQLFPTVPKSQKGDTATDSVSATKEAS